MARPFRMRNRLRDDVQGAPWRGFSRHTVFSILMSGTTGETG